MKIGPLGARRRAARPVTVALVAALVAAALTGAITSAPQAAARHSGGPPVVAQRPALSPTLPALSVRLPDIPLGETFRDSEVLAGFGCDGGNISPAIRWHGAPPGTESYLVTMFDIDAPTSSGFWHWTVWNVPGSVRSLPAGAGTPGDEGLPEPAVLGRSDFGEVIPGYGGPCPPAGERPHRYVFTVVALDIADLAIPADLPTAGVNVVMREHALAAGYRTVRFGR